MKEHLSLSQFSQELAQAIPHIARFSRALLSSKSDPLTEGKITLPQYLVLDLLDTGGSLKMKDIALALHISLPAVSGLIKRLVALAMVKRVYDEIDRRVVYVIITGRGKRTVEYVKSARKRIIHEMFSDLSERERVLYLRIIRKVKKSLYGKNDKT